MPQSLNRFGIALNFLAGLLLAPQLIGEERLRAFERWGTVRAAAFAAWVQRVADRSPLRGWPRPSILGTAAGIVLTGALWVGIVSLMRWLRGADVDLDRWWTVWPDALVLFVLVAPPTYAVLRVLATDSLVLSPASSKARGSVALLIVVAAFPVALPVMLFDLAIVVVSRTLDGVVRLTSGLANALGRRRWLGGVLTTTGILLFTAGNGLQFWATYES